MYIKQAEGESRSMDKVEDKVADKVEDSGGSIRKIMLTKMNVFGNIL